MPMHLHIQNEEQVNCNYNKNAEWVFCENSAHVNYLPWRKVKRTAVKYLQKNNGDGSNDRGENNG